MKALACLLMLCLVGGASTVTAQESQATQESCQESLAVFRAVAEGLNGQRAQLELQLVATQQRLGKVLAELEKLKQAAEKSKPKENK